MTAFESSWNGALADAEKVLTAYDQGRKSAQLKYYITEVIIAVTTIGVGTSSAIWPKQTWIPAVLGYIAAVIAATRLIFHFAAGMTRLGSAGAAIYVEIRRYKRGLEPYNDDSAPNVLMTKLDHIQTNETREWADQGASGGRQE